ncbi:MAPEG family protein [Veronia pacifica]|uniref:MAPEG family protein n=1 Tax=Veronia pacifica TaxID=1080227 RepID=A0A1C3EBU1_9GAMM|nr:MAPEG family protein [Veronia pacifica]ODA30660.1 hypothetical protein A8L45_19490 [Veronia pacifica]
MFYPMFMMFSLVFIIGLYMLKVRIDSVKSREVHPKFYVLMQGQEVPKKVQQTARSFVNQFELPILFYVASCLYISQGIESDIGLWSAWLFVVFRYAHAFVHVTSNNLNQRMGLFILSILFLITMLIDLLLHML